MFQVSHHEPLPQKKHPFQLASSHLPLENPQPKTWGLCLPGSWIPQAGLGLLKLGLEVAKLGGERWAGPLRVSWSLLRLFFFPNSRMFCFPQQKELLNLLAVGDITYAHFFFPDFFVVNAWDVKFQDGPPKKCCDRDDSAGKLLELSGWHGLVDGFFFWTKLGGFHVGCMDPSGWNHKHPSRFRDCNVALWQGILT